MARPRAGVGSYRGEESLSSPATGFPQARPDSLGLQLHIDQQALLGGRGVVTWELSLASGRPSSSFLPLRFFLRSS